MTIVFEVSIMASAGSPAAAPPSHLGDPKPRRVSALARVSVVVASLIITLVACEVAARTLFPPVPKFLDDRLVASGYYAPDPVLGWRPRPNVAGRYQRFDATFQTNSRGLRDREYPLARRPGVARIVVLGDSFTWGFGVNDDQIFTKVLERRLGGPEVINLGVTAFGTRQEIEYLKREGLQYRPDTVILAFCLNDIYRDDRPPAEQYQEHQRSSSRRASAAAMVSLKAWLEEHLILYQLARQAINTNKPLVNALVRMGLKDKLLGFEGLDTNLMPALRVYPPALQRSLDQTKADLLELRQILTERNIRFILALIPSAQSIDGRAFRHSIAYTKYEEADFDLEKPYRLFEGFAREHEIEVLDAYPALKLRHEAGEHLYLANDPHFDPAGHQAFAAVLAQYLNGAHETRRGE
jgi:hypothetical protein